MAFTDLFRTRRANKIHEQVWQTLWERVKTPPTEDAGARELHVVCVGTLLYATSYQAAIASGMDEAIAKTVALQNVAEANFDEQMRDRVLSVFSAKAEHRMADHAATLNRLTAALVDQTKTRGRNPAGEQEEELLKAIQGLMPLLAGQLAADG
ncbi:MAG: hypothetical protein P1P84_23635 [Deferrisomatales bacterium]|nr:hypothetical protein [Deferrisomatales bacterium]